MSRITARARPVIGLTILAAMAIAPAFTAGPKFYPDDPIQREPESRDASGVEPWDIGLMYEISMNLFATPYHKPSNKRALNVNTIDEVPDSSWFTNRIGRLKMTPEDIARGPNVGRPPAPEKWVIVRDKESGAKPGFTGRDANGETWFVQFDDRGRLEASTAAIEIASVSICCGSYFSSLNFASDCTRSSTLRSTIWFRSTSISPRFSNWARTRRGDSPLCAAIRRISCS